MYVCMYVFMYRGNEGCQFMLSKQLKFSLFTKYCIALYFGEPKFLQIVIFEDFVEIIWRICYMCVPLT